MVLAPIPMIDWKGVFRARAKDTRRIAAQAQSNAGRFAAANFMATFAPKNPAKIALYHPQEDELDTWPLAEALAVDGHTVLLPVVVGKKQPLIFREYKVGQELTKGAYGIMEPEPSSPVAIPDIIVTPLLGIRPDGARLGMGGGYYDRTLAALRVQGTVVAIGYGYHAQRMDRFPVDDHDQFLDGFACEQRAEPIERRR